MNDDVFPGWREATTACVRSIKQGWQILSMSGVTVTSASQILESFWNIWSLVSQRKKPFSDFPARGLGMYTLSCIHGKLKSMMTVIK